MATQSVVGTNAVSQASGTTSSITLPAGISSGDLIFVAAVQQLAGGVTIDTAGYAPMKKFSSTSGNDRSAVWGIKSADGTESSTTVGFSHNSQAIALFCIVLSPSASAYSKIVSPPPQFATVTDDASPTLAAVTPTIDDAVIIHISHHASGDTITGVTTDDASATNIGVFTQIGGVLGARCDYVEQATAAAYAGPTHTYTGAGGTNESTILTIAFEPDDLPEHLEVSQVRVQALLAAVDANAAPVSVSQVRVQALEQISLQDAGGGPGAPQDVHALRIAPLSLAPLELRPLRLGAP